MSYDLFVSYSRRDDKRGQVRALKEQIEADYRDFAGEELRCFFDLEDIASMDDWRHRILEGLATRTSCYSFFLRRTSTALIANGRWWSFSNTSTPAPLVDRE